MKYLFIILAFEYFLILNAENFMVVEQPEAKIFMEQLHQEMKKVKTVAFEFQQEKQLVLFEDTLFITGWCYVEKPGKIRWEYTSPIRKKILLCNDSVKIYKGSEEISSGESQGLLTVYRYILSFFDGKIDVDNSNFVYTLKKNREDQDIFLIEMKSQGKLTQFIDHIEMKISQKASRLVQFLLFEPNGDYTVIKVSSYILNPQLTHDLFDKKVIEKFQDGFSQK